MRSWVFCCEFISITKMRKREQHGNPNWLIELIDCVKKETLCWITNSRLAFSTSIEFDGCTMAGVERHNGTETKSNQNDEFSFNSIRRKTAVRYQFYYENRSCILPVFSMYCVWVTASSAIRSSCTHIDVVSNKCPMHQLRNLLRKNDFCKYRYGMTTALSSSSYLGVIDWNRAGCCWSRCAQFVTWEKLFNSIHCKTLFGLSKNCHTQCT